MAAGGESVGGFVISGLQSVEVMFFSTSCPAFCYSEYLSGVA